MDSSNALDDSLEELGDKRFDLVYFTYLEDLLQLCQEKSLLDAVGKGPVLEQTLK